MIADLYTKLKQLDVRVQLVDDKLELHAPKGVLNKELLEEIRLSKEDLIDFINTYREKKEDYHAIRKIPLQDSYPLSASQRSLWVVGQFEDGNVAYNMPGAYVFEGRLDLDAFTRAFDTLIARHETLRTAFRADDKGEVRQFIHSPEESRFRVGFKDMRNEPDKDNKVKYLAQSSFLQPFNLSEGPLLRAGLYQLEDQKWVFSYAMHHIISDGWSMQILLKELLVLYNAYCQGHTDPLKPLRIQYKDYVAWHHQQLSGDTLNDHKQYWLEHFAGELPVLEFPADYPRPALKTYNGKVVEKMIGVAAIAELKTLFREQGATLFMGFMAVVNALLYRYTGQEDIIIGTPTAGRGHDDLEDQIGFYVNTLALRTQFNGNDSFIELLEKVKQVTVGAYGHEVYPFAELVDALHLHRDMSRNPLFDVQVIVGHGQTGDAKEQPSLHDLRVSAYEGDEVQTSRFDIVFSFFEAGEDICASILYNSDIYSESSILRLADHLQQMTAAIAAAPSTGIRQLEYLSRTERETLLTTFQGPRLDYPAGKTVLDLFNEQVRLYPDKTALVFENTRLTYKELDEKAGRLAAHLQLHYQLQPDEMVGLMVDRSEKMIIGIWGILKAGGAYVPVDPDYPANRKAYMLQDTNVRLLLTQTDYIFDLEYYQGEIFAMDLQLDDTNGDLQTVPPASPAHLAYVIYTSGSTGTPKGVLITHGNLMHSVVPRLSVYEKEPAFLLLSSVAFDSSVAGIFGSLCSGGTLFLAKKNDAVDPDWLSAYIADNNITHLLTVPSYYKLLLSELADKANALKQVIVAGEACLPQLVTTHFNTPSLQYCDLFNEYGPTEATVWSSVHQYQNNGIPQQTIGKPIPNTAIHILDNNLQLVPVGVIGEICIAGAGLARGYLHQPELTNEKFIPHPFQQDEYIYRTGDLGRWLENGTIEFTGRKDDQVKIRGYRIELGEVENALQMHPDIVLAAVTTPVDAHGNKVLAAYVVGNTPLNAAVLQTYLKDLLPVYAIPAHYIQLDELPLTPNGKVDRKKLPELKDADILSGARYEAPRNETEEKFAIVWQDVLDKEKIGIREGFFESGGDSIRILQMVTELRKRFDIEVPIAAVYKNNTIAEIVAYLETEGKLITRRSESNRAIEALVRAEIAALKENILTRGNFPDKENIDDLYPMSDVEKGMTFESLLNDGLSVYHDQMVHTRLFINFDIARFNHALQLLADKHEILRTAFNPGDYERPVQIVYKKVPASAYYQDLSDLSEGEQEEIVRNFVQSELNRPFEITQAPLWRMAAFNFGNDRIVFVWQCHHAIIDGWSDALFNTELNNLYIRLGEEPGFIPEKLKASYKDFIIQHEVEKRDEVSRNYWKTALAGYRRLNIFSEIEEYSAFSQFIDSGLLQQLNKTAASLNTTVKAVSLSAYLYMLRLLNDDAELVAGYVTNTRPVCEDSDKILGCFLNAVPLRMTLENNITGQELAAQVHRQMIALKDNERLSLLEISQLHGEQLNAGNPFFDTFFNYVDFHVYNAVVDDDRAGMDDNTFAPVDIAGNGHTNTWLDFTIDRTGGFYRVAFQLHRNLKAGFTAPRLGALFINILSYIVRTPALSLAGLDYMDAAEKELLLHTFNDTATSYPFDKTIIRLFEEQVVRTPQHTALVFEYNSLTYAALNEWGNRLGNYLRRTYHISPDDIIGVQLERSEWLVIALLGILKSGAAYLSVDPAYPVERINYMITDSNCKILITEELISTWRKEGELDDVADPVSVNTPGNLACVIYTSGSTGNPKGCMLENTGIVNHLFNKINLLALSEESVICHNSQLHFVGGIWQLWAPLIAGGKVVLCNNEELTSIGKLLQRAEISGAAMLEVIPSQLNEHLFYEKQIDFSHIDTLILTGEKLSPHFVERCYAGNPHLKIFNTYGQTECSDVTTSCLIPQGSGNKQVLIGKPIENTRMYILAGDVLCPVGVIGEICAGGPGVGRGYINQPKLTAGKFVPNPFRKGERMYRTGDLGRWLPDGNIEITGRKDDQISIRGYRVELGEIQHALLQYDGIEEVVLIPLEGLKEEKTLLAAMVSRKQLEVTALRAFLSARLPMYMIPARYVLLDKMPLLPNGKVDKKAILQLQGEEVASGVKYIAPHTPVQLQLAAIWADVLQRENIGINDNFFELGGYSLLLIPLMNRINAAFAPAAIRLFDLVKYPTVAQLEELLLTPAVHHPHILMMRDGTHDLTTFILPGMPGISDGYGELAAQVPGNGAVYGLQMKGLLAGEKPLNSITDMATHNIALIRSMEHVKRIALYAHSYGGTIAYEMLRQLKDTDIEVTDLVLVESFPLNKTTISDEAEIFNLMATFLLKDEAVLPYVPEISAYQFFHEKGVSIPEDEFNRLWSVCKESLLIQYAPQEQLDRNVTFILSNGRGKSLETAWSRHFREVRVLHSAGDHFSIVKAPHCADWMLRINP